ncbi:hypothetical protein ACFUN7_01135 [Streptomyces sp. NPDC057236]
MSRVPLSGLDRRRTLLPGTALTPTDRNRRPRACGRVTVPRP